MAWQCARRADVVTPGALETSYERLPGSSVSIVCGCLCSRGLGRTWQRRARRRGDVWDLTGGLGWNVASVA